MIGRLDMYSGKVKRITRMVIPLMWSIIAISCTAKDYGSISIHTIYIPPKNTSVLYTASLPKNAYKVAITITSTDFSPIIEEVMVASNPSGTTIDNIPAGVDRYIIIEVKDPAGNIIARGRTTNVRIESNVITSVNILITNTNVFTELPSRIIPRAFAVSVPMPDGTLLISGGIAGTPGSCGINCIRVTATGLTEIYDPETGIFEQGPPMLHPRVFFTANMLTGGNVIITGGADYINIVCDKAVCSISIPTSGLEDSIEVYDPKTKNFYLSHNLTIPRAGHSANILTDDNILISGGISINGPTNTAELIDAKSNTVNYYSMTAERVFHAGVTYPVNAEQNSIFVYGGNSSGSTIETFNLQSGFTTNPGLASTITSFLSASLFISVTSKAIFNGGFDTSWHTTNQLIIIDTTLNSISSFNTMPIPKALFSDILLGDGNMLIAGGVTTSTLVPTACADVFSPVKVSFLKEIIMNKARAGYSAQTLPDGAALIAGGFSALDMSAGTISFVDTAEIYNP